MITERTASSSASIAITASPADSSDREHQFCAMINTAVAVGEHRPFQFYIEAPSPTLSALAA